MSGMELREYRIDDLVIPDFSIRKCSPEMMNKLKMSIGEHGYIEPIVVNTVNNHVVGGRMRLEALKDLGYTTVYAVPVTIRIPEKEIACAVALDKVLFDWDEKGLQNALYEISMCPINFLALTGFGKNEIKNLKQEEAKIGFDGKYKIIRADPRRGTKIREGDLFHLGRHRLLCGNCTSENDLDRLMEGIKADMVFTDPPFLKHYESDEWYENPLFEKHIKDAHVFVMYDDENIIRYLKSSRLHFVEFFVADFGFPALIGDKDYLQHILISHETFGSPVEPDTEAEDFNSVVKMRYRGTLEEERTIHFQQKSVSFVQLFIDKYAQHNVLDIFGGSGTTLLACEHSGKTCYMTEIEPRFCQLIIERWEKMTGKKAEKVK